MRGPQRVAVIFASSLFIAGSAKAITVGPDPATFAAGGDIEFNGETGVNPDEETTPQSTGLVSQTQDTSEASYSAAAGIGQLHAMAEGHISAGPAASAIDSEAVARLTINDVMFTSAASSINTMLNLSLDGSITGTGDNGTSDSSISDIVFSYVVSDANNIYLDGGDVEVAPYSLAPGSILTSDEFNVPTNVDLTVTLSLTAEAIIGGSASGNPFAGPASVDVDFSNTLSFATTGPVFSNPDSTVFTANSSQGGIVANDFVVPTGVPEPVSTSLMMMAGGLMLFGRRRTSTR